MRKKPTKNKKALVLGFLENISSKIFSDYPQQLTDLVGKKHGVYALYKGKRLYYVGLATNLRGRIKQHLKDKHTGKWDKFSLYLIKKAEHIKELETLIMRVADPTGNTVKGKLPNADNLKSNLEHNIKSAQNKKLIDLLDRKVAKKKTKKNVAKKSKTKKQKAKPTLMPYINKFKKSFRIRGIYKGITYKAIVNKSGTVRFNGNLYNSPSVPGQVITNRATNGWFFWKFKNEKGEWVRLDELRK
ncbi:MAG: GIY-YIG nuclease family protein [candidate division Zixibacteria bacterium]|nr:GIY-YIG nuclease family protein [candidate division Zixibacteria bacterium]